MNTLYDKMQKAIERNYTCIVNYQLDNTKDVYLDNEIKPRRCRFCGKTETETSFDSVSHAIPHLIGNRLLKSLYECDNCNKKVFSKYEEQFDAYMRFYHVLCHVSRNGNTVIPINVIPNPRLVLESLKNGHIYIALLEMTCQYW